MIDAEERAAMEQAVRGALADAVANGADGDAALAKLGWLELLRDEPGDAIGIVFSALGATRATATALDDLLAQALGAQARGDLAVLLPGFAAWDPPARIDAGELVAQGLTTGRIAGAERLLVVGGDGSRHWSVVVPVAEARVETVRGIDPEAGLHRLSARGRAADATPLAPGAWPTAVALARRALAHQIAGASRSMLELARSHALTREQFGRPIASFQAVRHRLADSLVAVESLEAALSAAAEVPGPETAALAKAIAGRTAQSVSRHCQQVLAGIGFTSEHAFHRLLKRALALEGLFGSADAIALDLGRRLLAERRVPTLIEL